jgi:hypothetical protein
MKTLSQPVSRSKFALGTFQTQAEVVNTEHLSLFMGSDEIDRFITDESARLVFQLI